MTHDVPIKMPEFLLGRFHAIIILELAVREAFGRPLISSGPEFNANIGFYCEIKL